MKLGHPLRLSGSPGQEDWVPSFCVWLQLIHLNMPWNCERLLVFAVGEVYVGRSGSTLSLADGDMDAGGADVPWGEREQGKLTGQLVSDLVQQRHGCTGWHSIS